MPGRPAGVALEQQFKAVIVVSQDGPGPEELFPDDILTAHVHCTPQIVAQHERILDADEMAVPSNALGPVLAGLGDDLAFADGDDVVRVAMFPGPELEKFPDQGGECLGVLGLEGLLCDRDVVEVGNLPRVDHGVNGHWVDTIVLQVW